MWINNNWQVITSKAKTGSWSTKAIDYPNRPIIHRLGSFTTVIKNVRITVLIIGPYLIKVLRRA